MTLKMETCIKCSKDFPAPPNSDFVCPSCKAIEFAERYPQHTILKRVAGESQSLGEFLEWLTDPEEGGLILCSGFTHGYGETVDIPPKDNPWPDALLARYFNIDYKALQKEKDAMVEEMREAQG